MALVQVRAGRPIDRPIRPDQASPQAYQGDRLLLDMVRRDGMWPDGSTCLQAGLMLSPGPQACSGCYEDGEGS